MDKEIKQLIKEAKELLTNRFPPLIYGEDSFCEEMWDLLNKIEKKSEKMEIERPYLLRYNLNFGGYKNQLNLIYATSYDKAVDKLKKHVSGMSSQHSSFFIVGEVENLNLN